MGTERQAIALTVMAQLGPLRARLPRATDDAVRLLEGVLDGEAAARGGARLALEVRGAAYGFPDVPSALAWCGAVQRAALALDWPAALLKHPEAEEVRVDGVVVFRGPRVAMAVHLDPPDELAAAHLGRVLDVAAGGRVLVTAEAAAHADPRGPDRVVAAGSVRLDGLPGEQVVHELVLDGLGRGFGVPAPAPRGRYEGRPFFGRQGDLASLDELVTLGIRVVCVQGAPGVGKSRLLSRFARNKIQGGSPVACVDLARASGPWDVLLALGSALDVPLREDRGEADAVHRVATAVTATPGLVVVVDHADRPFARELLAGVVRRAPGSRWLIASGARLGVAAEAVWELQPLPHEEVRSADAVRLFEDRARLASPSFQLGTGSEVHAIVAELGGNPLAIEIAAASVPALRPLAVFDRLTARRGAPLRVLDLVLEGALDGDDRACLRELTVFGGSFAPSIAEEVMGEGSAPRLGRLAALGLLQRVEELGAPGVRRLRVHPRVRERLREGGGPHPALGRLAGALSARCATWLRELTGPRAALATARMEIELPEIEAVSAALLDQPRVGAAELAWLEPLLDVRAQVGVRRGVVGPLLEPLQRALTAVGMCFDLDPMVAAGLLRVRGLIWERLGEWEKAVGDLRRAESLAERWGDAGEVARALLHIGRARLGQGRLDDAIEALRESAGAYEQAGDEVAAARARSALGAALTGRGEVDDAEDELARAANGYGDRASPWARAGLAERSALLARRRRDLPAACSLYARAVGAWQQLGLREREAWGHFQLSTLLHGARDLEGATRHLAAADQLAWRCGDQARRGLVLTQLGLVQLELGLRDQAHRSLVQAVSAARAGGDRAGQGVARGFLGLLHHVAGRLEEARDAYRGALRDLESGGERRYGALFHSCLGAAEAELGNLDDARILVDLAQLQLGDDPSFAAAMALFHRSVDLARAEVAEAAGDAATAKDLRDGVRAALAAVRDLDDDIYARVARGHLEDLVGAVG